MTTEVLANSFFVLPDCIHDLRERIDAALEDSLRLSPGCPATLRQAMEYALLAPGKRIRPLLTLLAAQACGGPVERALPAACAVEMVHAYSLVHDDLPAMDNDDYRRGRLTCHRQFGEALAILAGDALLDVGLRTPGQIHPARGTRGSLLPNPGRGGGSLLPGRRPSR